MEKIAIIGSGIAALTAAIYAARANLKPVVIAGKDEGGQLMLTTTVENYPGFPEGVMGPELVERTREQAKKFGTRFFDGNVTLLERKGESFTISTSEEETMDAKAVIIATGASARLLGLPSEKTYWNRGVHTCATCDAYFYNGKEVVVVGGGDSAMEESLFLTNNASKVTIIHRREAFRASKIMQERVLAHPKIKVVWNQCIEEIKGDGTKVTAISLKDMESGKTVEMPTDAVFLAIGHIPNTGFVQGLVELERNGFIKTDGRTRTTVPGIFAAGDVQDPIYKQAITAAGSGCQAALEAERYLEGH